MIQWLRTHPPMRGFNCWFRKIPQTSELLSPGTTSAELLSPRARTLQQEKPPQREAHVHLMRRVDSLEKTLMLGGIWGRRRRG